MPSFLETVALNGDGYENLPTPDAPYYVVAREGYFLHKHTQIGNVLIKEYQQPKTLGRIGYAGGVFTWEGPKIPADIISQAHDFFARIYAKHSAEAEVLITKHNETGTFRLFVPYQRVSHAGVKSIYEPTHVDRNYTVVGTLHSHCDFTAFHSGTDSGDASDMDGVHFTIGRVNTETPEIVGMVAMNGKEFHYKEPRDIADIEWKTATAPPWWDQYVFETGKAPLLKPAGLTSLTQEHWDEFLGRALVAPKAKPPTTSAHLPPQNRWVPTNGTQGTFGKSWERSDWEGYNTDWRKDLYGNGNQWSGYKNPAHDNDSFNPVINTALDKAEEMGLFDDSEWVNITASEADDVTFWVGHFNVKLGALLDIIQLLEAEERKPKSKPKPRPRMKGRPRR